MKIIARSANGFLVEMTDNEMAQVSIFDSKYSSGFKAEVGGELPVGEHYKEAQAVLTAYSRNSTRFQEISTDLSHLLALMATCEPKKKK